MKILVLAVAAFVLGLAAVSPASASHLFCGQVVFVDVVLDSDLLDCKGHGLVVGASGVDIDLDGHLIDGEGPPPPFTSDYPGEGDFGIYNPAFQDVTIVGGKGGRIQGFDTGIVIEGATNNLVERVDVSDNRTGIYVWKNSTKVSILRNRLEHNVVVAIQVGTSSDVEIARNVIVESIFWGISVFSASDVTVERNDVNGGSIGISVSDGMRNSVLRNDVSEATRSNLHVGIQVDAGAVETTVARNTVAGSDGDGISVDLEADLTVVMRNITEKNDDDGIDVNSSSTTLGKNLAVGNGDLGIEAVPGVTDLGANSASGNGDPRQCTNVVCRR